MLKNYLKIAFRSLLKFKAYSGINLLGLALGLTSGILILLYVVDELSFDKFHTKADRIYRVGTDIVMAESGQSDGHSEANGWPIGYLLERDFPEVEKVVYLRNGSFLQINREGKRFTEKIYFAGETFFDLFSFPLIKGDPATALKEPYTIVLTETMAAKYFPDEDALGKTLVMGDSLSFVVSGVMKDIPRQSHMQFGMLASFNTYPLINKDFTYEDGWGNINIRNYVLLKPGVDVEAFKAKARNIYIDHVEKELKAWGAMMYVDFEPLPDIYLHTERGNGMGPLGSAQRVYMVAGIALFVILLACINFINLATARSMFRAREVGLRKVVGSSRGGLIRQFLSESLVITLMAFTFSIVMVTSLLPLFNQLVDKDFSLRDLTQPAILLGTGGLIIFITLTAGYYPALVLSALRPVEVLKGKWQTGTRGVRLRRSLVVFQFVISIGLVICTMVVINQLRYMQYRDLGFNKDQIVVVNATRLASRDLKALEVFKNELKALAPVEEVSFVNAIPGRGGWIGQWAFPEGRPKEESVSVEYTAVDEDFVKTLGLKIIAGRNFDPNRPSDIEDGLLINETSVSMMGWGTPENAIGKRITSPSGYPEGTVIGVLKDYHEFGLQQPIGPMVMDYNMQAAQYFAIRYSANNTTELLESIDVLWKQHFEGNDFVYFFLSEDFSRQYQSEQRLAKVFMIFSFTTILIACIGLLGLVSFMVTSRTKEIGVRKVLGADAMSIASLLSKEFVLLVFVANLITIPLAWYLADLWLQTFAYRVTLGPGIFILAFGFAIVITLLTVSVQTIRAALSNPVKSLRYE